MLVISVLLSSAHLSVLIGEEIWKRPWFLISVQSLLDVFGVFPAGADRSRAAGVPYPIKTRSRSVSGSELSLIEPRRAHHVMADKVTFPRAPLQSGKVGFPDSGFDLGFPRKAFPRR